MILPEMEALQQARILYKQRYQYQGLAFLNDRYTNQLEAKVQRLIEIAIKEVPSVILFQTPDYLNIFERALKSHGNTTSEIKKLKKTYECLEKYFLQLVEQPWKREFKKIKLYGGFYRTRIKNTLPEPEGIFMQAGYSLHLDKQVLKLENDVQAENVLLLAFDSRLCREQCKIITEHYEVVRGLSVSLEQAINDVLYSDRSRGRENVFVSSAYESNELPVDLQPINKTSILTPSLGVPNIPKREPMAKYLPPEEAMGPVIDLQNRKLKRQHGCFESPQNQYIQPYLPQLLGTPKNGHVSQEEWDQFSQSQMSGKINGNYGSANEIPPTHSALHNVAVSVPSEPYPQSTLTGMQKLSINESYDEGIVKDFSRTSKSSREVSACYPSIPAKSGLHQIGTAAIKPPSSNLQPSMADQGYNIAFSSNGQTIIPNSARAVQMLPHQSQQSFGNVNGIYVDGVSSPPVGPPPIPPRALKPDYGIKGNAVLPNHAAGYAFSHHTAKSNNVTQSDIIKVNPATHAINTKFQESSVISSASMLPPMPASKLSHSGPVLRRDRQPLGFAKSSSLKYNVGTAGGGTASSLLQQSHSRVTRSMDLSGLEWQCHLCTSKNTSSDTVCSVCCGSRLKSFTKLGGEGLGSDGHLQPLDNDPVPGVSKKPCPACTLENEPDRTHCSLCEAQLENPYTYV